MPKKATNTIALNVTKHAKLPCYFAKSQKQEHGWPMRESKKLQPIWLICEIVKTQAQKANFKIQNSK